MTQQQAIEYARSVYAGKRLHVGEVEEYQVCEFGFGAECHSVSFEGGATIHFDVGRYAWELPVDSPWIRLRNMTHTYRNVAETEYFSC